MKWVIGIDEVGRGPLAGPVTVCTVAMRAPDYKKYAKEALWKTLNDSKQLSAAQREYWEHEARILGQQGIVQIALSSRTAAQIDRKGIAVCIRECIAANLSKLSLDPLECSVLLDGSLKAPKEYLHQQTIIKGDSKEKIIAMASVVAKVSRDAYMAKQHKKHASYGWNANKGYGTKAHRSAILEKGITSLHRQSFLTRVIDKKGK
ncbi:MAG: ribonuclease HII [Patescibacteria group bacterium]